MGVAVNHEVGSLLRSLRGGAEMTQQALAAAAGCSKAYLSLVESGQRTLSVEKARAVEAALGIHDGRLLAALQWQRVPQVIRAEVEHTHSRSAALTRRLREALQVRDGRDGRAALAALRALVAGDAANIDAPVPPSCQALPLRRQIPIINKVAAGYPREFTDLDYPASVADAYLACPDVSDPDAFAARVVGDSMEPEYHEGDIVVFSPLARIEPRREGGGTDCFVRLERDAETTFKRVYFEDDGRRIRLQPLNSMYPPRTLERDDVAGLYAAVYVMRKVGTR